VWLPLLRYKGMLGKVKLLCIELKREEDAISILQVTRILLDIDGLICLICEIKYQLVCDCYLKVLYTTVLFSWC